MGRAEEELVLGWKEAWSWGLAGQAATWQKVGKMTEVLILLGEAAREKELGCVCGGQLGQCWYVLGASCVCPFSAALTCQQHGHE